MTHCNLYSLLYEGDGNAAVHIKPLRNISKNTVEMSSMATGDLQAKNGGELDRTKWLSQV